MALLPIPIIPQGLRLEDPLYGELQPTRYRDILYAGSGSSPGYESTDGNSSLANKLNSATIGSLCLFDFPGPVGQNWHWTVDPSGAGELLGLFGLWVKTGNNDIWDYEDISAESPHRPQDDWTPILNRNETIALISEMSGLSEAEAQALIAAAIAPFLTQAQIQALINAAIAAIPPPPPLNYFPSARYVVATLSTLPAVIDTGVLTSQVSSVTYELDVMRGTSVEHYSLSAINNRIGTTPATVCMQRGPLDILRYGATILGVTPRIILTGAGATQRMALRIETSSAVTVHARMTWVQRTAAQLTLAQLEGA